jgi:phosphoribosylanthranilate isomerase
MKIKICGLTRIADVDAVNAALPDFVGFVFADSRRKVGFAEAAALRKRLDARIRAVGIFVDADPGHIVRLCESGVIELVQLHGNEDAEYIIKLKNAADCPVIKAVRMQSPAQVRSAEALPCDWLLLDTFRPDAAGGTGEAFDHTLIPALKKPFFLAGGLNAGNLKKAAALAHKPFCLDVSSGAETGGLKDAAKIREIVRIVREEIT